MRTFRLLLIALLLIAVPSVSFGDVDVVIDDFESYASDAALQAQWVSTSGSTISTFLADENTPSLPYPIPPDPGAIDGQAAIFDGAIGVGDWSVNEWADSFSLAPSATQNVELSVDIGDDADSTNAKLTMGLRYVGDATENILEMGFQNSEAGKLYAFRNVLFPGSTNWNYFSLDESLDNPAEVGPGFHTYKVVVSQTDLTFTLDLYGDGLDNAATIAAGFDVPGVDAEDVVTASITSNGFNNIRFGLPSATGSSTSNFIGIDNVSLRLVDVESTIDTDFDDDGDTDLADLMIQQRGFGVGSTNADGDTNADFVVDATDLANWKSEFTGSPVTAAVGAIPEPTSATLCLLAVAGLAFRRR